MKCRLHGSRKKDNHKLQTLADNAGLRRRSYPYYIHFAISFNRARPAD